jgi:MFS family permease
MGTMQVTWTHLVNLWFERNRGLSLALVLSGTGLAAALIPSAVTWSIARWGWQAAFLFLALLPVTLVLPLAIGWMKTPAKASPEAMAGSAKTPARGIAALPGIAFGAGIRSANFWFLNIALTLVVAAVVTMVTNTVPMLRDKGLSASDASKVFGSFGLSLIFGRLIVGYLVDRLWAPAVAAVAIAMPALGCFLLWTTGASDIPTLVIATFLVGVGAGAEFDVAAYLVSRYFGLRDYGRLFGVHLGLITAGAALAPLLTGAIYKATGSYSTMLALCGAAFLMGALMLLPLGRYPKFAQAE